MLLIPWMFSLVSLFAMPGTAGSLAVSDTTSGYTSRSIDGQNAVLSLDTVPNATLGLAWKRTALTLGYGPRLTVLDQAGSGRSYAVLHSMDGGLSYRGVRLTVGGWYAASLGKQYLGNLVRAPGIDPSLPPDPATSRVSPLPAAQVLSIRSEQATGRASYIWSRRLRSDVSASHTSIGGRDAESQLLLPRVRSVLGLTSLSYSLTPLHNLVSGLEASHIKTSAGYEYIIGGVSEGWTARWSRTTTSRLQAGFQLVFPKNDDFGETPKMAPSGVASVASTFSVTERTRAIGQFGTGMAQTVNVLTGKLQLAAQTTLTVGVQVAKTTMQLAFDGYQTLPTDGPDATRVAGVGVRIAHEVTKWLDVGGSTRLQQQNIANAVVQQPPQWVLSANVAMRAPPVLF